MKTFFKYFLICTAAILIVVNLDAVLAFVVNAAAYICTLSIGIIILLLFIAIISVKLIAGLVRSALRIFIH
jgi:hypothetical protein